ncbi:Cyclic-AMP phosphodiesterase class-II protein [Rutstroemia sp. NJR-2017a BVV2]|nr:Cyclic-AMP phosphodiesterase class-II protein [Rutstroemia sp. NJR-2017a BVV2]
MPTETALATLQQPAHHKEQAKRPCPFAFPPQPRLPSHGNTGNCSALKSSKVTSSGIPAEQRRKTKDEQRGDNSMTGGNLRNDENGNGDGDASGNGNGNGNGNVLSVDIEMQYESSEPGLQVIVLGSRGGPFEDNCTAMLVRSVALNWDNESVLAVDTGVHISAINTLLKESVTSDIRPTTVDHGPFAGLKIKHKNIEANTGDFLLDTLGAVLITHPHIDHIAGGIVGTALGSRKPRCFAGLTSTIEALKAHIFNDIIWPNLSDEDDGVGAVTFNRLISGGSPVLGTGHSEGYVEIDQDHNSSAYSTSPREYPIRDRSSPSSPQSRRNSALHNTIENIPQHTSEKHYAYNSTAYFIQDKTTLREVLIFGDVEPDSISILPRNQYVWNDAAPKIVEGRLKAILIECSYNDARPDDKLFGHMNPRHLMQELCVLAREVENWQGGERLRERKKINERGEVEYLRRGGSPQWKRKSSSLLKSPLSVVSQGMGIFSHGGVDAVIDEEAEDEDGSIDTVFSAAGPTKQNLLKGIKVVIIHVKDRLLPEPYDPGEYIMKQILAWEKEMKLGCEFILPVAGTSLYL